MTTKTRKAFEHGDDLDDAEDIDDLDDVDDVDDVDDDSGDIGDVDTDVGIKPVKEDDDDDDEDQGDDDEKQDRMLPKKRTHIYHQVPEYTEIKMVSSEDRVTSEYMTIYEFAMVVGTRATHIASGSILYTDPDGLYDPRDIAKKEIAEGKCPLSITRKVSPTMLEVWEVNEMIKPQ
jgi:DNA-directed RNA polymerase subunit K/omega